MNMASIDSNSDFANGSMSASASNTLNNKKNRKLKRVGQASTQQNESKDNVAFIEDHAFLQSQSFYNENQEGAPQPGQSLEERRAKSSMGAGESSAGRLRNKIAGAQK